MKQIILSNIGCTSVDVDMGDAGVVTFVARYNYTAECWTLDLLDSQGNNILTGIMLVPDVNLLHAYPEVGQTLGELYLVETTIDGYVNPESLGQQNYILWYSADEIGGNVA